jgi:hypothetical protein
MKSLDVINDTQKERLLKRAKTIFKAYKEGTITRSDCVSFSYRLDNMKPFVVNGKIEIYAFISKIVEITYCPLSEHGIMELIIKKFKNFNIDAELYYTPNCQIEKYQGKKPWEEPLNEDVKSFKKENPAEEKRARTIFKALRKGVVEVQHPRTNDIIKFRYHINDPVFYRWEYYSMMEMQLTIITSNLEGIIVNCDDKDIVDKCTNDLESISRNPTGIHLREMFMNKLKNRFRTFNVKIHINQPGMKFVLDEPNEELNEQNELIHLNDEDIKRVKLVHKAIRKGIVKVNDVRYRYEFPEKYYLSPTLKRPMIGFDFNKRDINKKDGGLKLPLKVWRIEEGEEIYINSLLNPRDVADIVHGQHYHLKDTTMEYMTVKNTVRRRYDNFSIALDLHYTVKPRTVNEQNIPRREPTKEQKKRAKILYHAFKTGKFTVEGDKQHNEHGGTYKYVLPDEYWTSIDDDGELCVILTMNPEQTMEMYYTHKDYQTGEMIEKHINRLTRKHLYQWMVDSIKRKFKQFQINIIF